MMNTRMNNRSLVFLEITANVSFQSLKKLNTCLINVSLNYWGTKNDVTQLNTCLANVSQNYWETKMMLHCSVLVLLMFH